MRALPEPIKNHSQPLPLQAVHGVKVQPAAMQCGACGAALPPGRAMDYATCGATLAINRLADAHARVDSLAPALRAHAAKPAPELVKRRLDMLGADIPRCREWAKDMEAESHARRGFVRGEGNDRTADWRSFFARETNPLRAVLLALVIWFVWWYG